MRVVLDMQSVLRNRHSGLFSYGAGLLEGFASLENPPELALFCEGKAAGNGHWLGETLSRLQVSWRVSRIKIRHLENWWRALRFPALQGLAGDFDVYHSIHHLMPPTRGKPRVLTVHDLRRYRYPEFYRGSRLASFERAVRGTDHVIAISEATKVDMQKFFEIPDERISVIHHGGVLKASRQEPKGNDNSGQEVVDRFGLQPGKYFAVLSSRDRRKNVNRMVQAFLRARNDLGDEYRLAVIGKVPAGELASAMPNGGDCPVVCVGPLDNVGPVLAESTALVYASLYEGFGLPILEAMAAGTAVVTSNCSSMPEVAGKAGLLVEPESVEDIAQAMIQLAGDEQLRQRLITAGAQRVKEFSWPRTAEQTLGVYRKLM